jgi:ubiquinone/menaquinone biosynthesis C-methylase UbiE
VGKVARDPNEFAQELFTGLPRRYDALAEVLSFGQNGRWRSEMVSHVADLRQRIPVQLRVDKGRTGSTVQQ